MPDPKPWKDSDQWWLGLGLVIGSAVLMVLLVWWVT